MEGVLAPLLFLRDEHGCWSKLCCGYYLGIFSPSVDFAARAVQVCHALARMCTTGRDGQYVLKMSAKQRVEQATIGIQGALAVAAYFLLVENFRFLGEWTG